MTRTIGVLVTLAVLAPAVEADDEGSEHTAQLVGDAADTLGVSVSFEPAGGWSMRVRAKPGAEEKTFALAIPKRHAHYIVYVTPGRAAIAWVEVSAGVEKGREKVSPKDTLAWVWSPTDGKLVRSWTYGELFSSAQLANLPRSISHWPWLEDRRVTKSGLELVTRGDAGKPRTIVLDAKATSLR